MSVILALMVDVVSSVDLQVRIPPPPSLRPTQLSFIDLVVCLLCSHTWRFLDLFRDLGCVLLCRVHTVGERP